MDDTFFAHKLIINKKFNEFKKIYKENNLDVNKKVAACTLIIRIIISSMENKDEVITFLLKKYNVDLFVKDDGYNRTALHHAVIHNNFSISKRILEINKKNINIEDVFGNEPLFYTIFGCANLKKNIPKMLKLLLRYCSLQNINHKNKNKTSILDVAKKGGYTNIIKLLESVIT